MSNLSRFVSRSKSGFVVGTRFSWADIALFGYFDAIRQSTNENMKKTVPALEKCSDLVAICKKVSEDSKVAAYVAQRKQTPF